jgi:hypothetical protein
MYKPLDILAPSKMLSSDKKQRQSDSHSIELIFWNALDKKQHKTHPLLYNYIRNIATGKSNNLNIMVGLFCR